MHIYTGLELPRSLTCARVVIEGIGKEVAVVVVEILEVKIVGVVVVLVWCLMYPLSEPKC